MIKIFYTLLVWSVVALVTSPGLLYATDTTSTTTAPMNTTTSTSTPLPTTTTTSSTTTTTTTSSGGGGSTYSTTQDTVAPSAPTNLTGVYNTTGFVYLSWGAATDNVGVAGYRVFRNSILYSTSTATSFNDNSISPGLTYSYYVKAYDATGNESSQSNVVSVNVSTTVLTTTGTTTSTTTSTTSTTTQPQTQTTSTSPVPAAPSEVRVVVQTTGAVQVSWQDNSDNENQFRIYRHLPGTTSIFTQVGSVGTDLTSFTETAVPAGSWEYSVTACNTYACSAYSAGAMIAVGTTTTVAAAKQLSGRISLPGGTPVTDGKVRAYNSATGQWFESFTSTSGEYALSLTSGEFQIDVVPVDSSMAVWRGQALSSVNFAQDGVAESRTLDAVVQALNSAQLKVVLKTSANVLISGAAVSVDVGGCVTSSTKNTTTTSTAGGGTQTNYSDSSGQVYFSLSSGTYCVRSFLSSERGFENPPEQEVLMSGDKSIEMVFLPQNLTTKVTISGKVKFFDGYPAGQALVSAWSESGGAAEVRADNMGYFNIYLSSGQQWRLKSGQEWNGKAYQSAEYPVSFTAVVPVELVLLEVYAIASSATATQVATTTATVQTTDGAKVSVPPNAVTTSGSVTVQIDPTVELPPPPDKTVVGSKGYDITVSTTSGSVTALQTGFAAEIILPYSDSDFAALGLDPARGIPSFYDEDTGAWVPVDNYVLDRANQRFVLKVSHFTKFAIVAPADVVPPAKPANVSAKNAGSLIVALFWTNPTLDFHHAKLYRSESSLVKGQVLATSVVGNTFRDSTALVGKQYYYRVSAVDTAGNESEAVSSGVVVVQNNADTDFSSGAGKLISHQGTVYMIDQAGLRRPFTSAGAFLSYGYNSFSQVKPASTEDLALPEGGFIPPQDGKVICSDRGTDKGTCYLITESKKAGFTSREVFEKLGFSFAKATYGDVSWMANTALVNDPNEAHRKGVLVNNSGTLQIITNNGTLGFPTAQVFSSWGFRFTDAILANAADKALTQIGVVKERIAGELSPR